MYLPVSVAAMLVGLSAASAAVAADPPPARWYLEAGGLYQRYPQYRKEWGRGRESVYAVLPVHLRVGMRLTDGSTLSLGAQYHYRPAPVTVVRPSSAGEQYRQTTRAVSTLALPLTFGAPVFTGRLAATPWRAYAQSGITLIHSKYLLKHEEPWTPPAPETAETLTDLPLALGGQVSYALGRHVELTAGGNVHFSYLVMLDGILDPATNPFSISASGGLRFLF